MTKTNNPLIAFKYFDEFPGWGKMPQFIEEFIIAHQIKSVFEIGAGANPTISADVVRRLGISYTINDIEIEELAKADAVYNHNVADLCANDIESSIANRYDLVFSRMAGEHFYNAKNLHANVYKLLIPGGYAIHCFSTLYALPFLVNKLVPDWLSDKLLALIHPRDNYYQHAKFKAYYDMSFGPSEKMKTFFTNQGYCIKEYVGYFGHPYYSKFPWLRSLEKHKAKWLIKHPVPLLTSYASVILKKSS
jgi:hypothetical protein